MKALLKKLFLSTSLIGMMVFSLVALAEECHRGTLDKRYCDIDRDLVADLPLDSSQRHWVAIECLHHGTRMEQSFPHPYCDNHNCHLQRMDLRQSTSRHYLRNILTCSLSVISLKMISVKFGLS